VADVRDPTHCGRLRGDCAPVEFRTIAPGDSHGRPLPRAAPLPRIRTLTAREYPRALDEWHEAIEAFPAGRQSPYDVALLAGLTVAICEYEESGFARRVWVRFTQRNGRLPLVDVLRDYRLAAGTP
jgi:hypothetical protein